VTAPTNGSFRIDQHRLGAGENRPPESNIPVRAVLAEDRDFVTDANASGLNQPYREVPRPRPQLLEGQCFPAVRPDDFQACFVCGPDVVKGCVEKVDQGPERQLCLHLLCTSCQNIGGAPPPGRPAPPLLVRESCFAVL